MYVIAEVLCVYAVPMCHICMVCTAYPYDSYSINGHSVVAGAFEKY
ncbi:hypothetical protein HMPREF0663_10069 [Hoylesella oralis ATCC 33269]|uniref:Uncharacterized protein n=1 Tax=Hoylesella oralis ATCC 33269 TaxID=873533 RepID=E7RLR9_9BACT|nr:hypothetical protein HMPREF0663_10069 [Hoylesella oralis ATCC 33269]